ncbi:MAG: tRNA lysidine(34) synthetase TilS [Deltaproteobacteria bacterium]|nr:tRNA lysidine(34) synthetase TilS [Deltaproteobacteria bacterium]
MLSLEQSLIDQLCLKASEKRSFVISVSGGLDSTVLAFALSQLRERFELELNLFHINFQLRGKESMRDEDFVKKLSDKLKIPLHLFREKISSKTAIQETARNLRLKRAANLLPEAEWVEAHQADDQIETFLFRMLRGSGLKGLSAMKALSLREIPTGKRKVWRPLLRLSKKDLLQYAKKYRLKFCEDSTNKKDKYDRNWLRLKVLPLLEQRFPKVRDALSGLISEIQTLEADQEKKFFESEREVVKNPDSRTWSWEKLQELETASRQRFLHTYFQRRLQLQLSRKQILDLENKILKGENFAFNAPKGVIVRGRRKSHSVKESHISLSGIKDDKRRIDIILSS